MSWTHSSQKNKWLINTWEKFSICVAIQDKHINTTLKSISYQSQCQLSRKQRKTNASEDVGKNSPHTMLLGMFSKCHAYTFTGNFNKCNSHWECQQESIIHCYLEYKGVSPLWKSWKLIQKQWENLKRALHNDPAILLLGTDSKDCISTYRKATAATHIYHSSIHCCQAVESAIMHTTSKWIKKMCYVYISGVFFTWSEWINYVIYG
jgi:hypothetical protein